MRQNKSTRKQQLIFETTNEAGVICCGVRGNGQRLIHRLAHERNQRGRGHDPGYVYLAYLPRGKYKGFYKIGKVEYTKVTTDKFDLDEIDNELMEALLKRMKKFHRCGKDSDEIYCGAQFIHGIRVACGEGAEKQPHRFFASKKIQPKNRELFDLDERDIEVFKEATGSILERPIKHLTAEEFANYLISEVDQTTISKYVVLPK